MKRVKSDIYPGQEDRELIEAVAKRCIQNMRDEGLTYYECIKVLEKCQFFMADSLLGEFIEL